MTEANSYSGYAELASNELRGKDFDIVISKQPSSQVAILAPHGGEIERGTTRVARLIADDDFNLYLFEGLKSSDNYETLHLSSHLFDEPECLSLISKIPIVVTIHGCNGKKDRIYLGGLNESLKAELFLAFKSEEISVCVEGHKYPGKNPDNICNRGMTNQGVQIELTDTLRGTAAEEKVVRAVRKVLLTKDLK